MSIITQKEWANSTACVFRTSALGFRSLELSIEHGVGTSNPGSDVYGTKRTITAAGTAFITGIAIGDDSFLILEHQDIPGTNVNTYATSGAFGWIELERNHVLQIS